MNNTINKQLWNLYSPTKTLSNNEEFITWNIDQYYSPSTIKIFTEYLNNEWYPISRQYIKELKNFIIVIEDINKAMIKNHYPLPFYSAVLKKERKFIKKCLEDYTNMWGYDFNIRLFNFGVQTIIENIKIIDNIRKPLQNIILMERDCFSYSMSEITMINNAIDSFLVYFTCLYEDFLKKHSTDDGKYLIPLRLFLQ